MTPIHPFKLPPSFREKIWGRSDFEFWFPKEKSRLNPVGEVWYSFDGNRLTGGQFDGLTVADLIEKVGARLVGPNFRPNPVCNHLSSERSVLEMCTQHNRFPILVKLLFTADQISVQVHPDDNYAAKHHGGNGKTEAWYIVAAEPESQIALGLTENLSPEKLRLLAETGQIVKHLNWINVKEGESYLIPSGTLHALGPGLVVCEIQQNSDFTYRIYDYDRVDTNGNPRPLHIEQAIETACLKTHYPITNSSFSFPESETNIRRELLVACRYFAIEKTSCSGPSQLSWTEASVRLLVILAGSGEILFDKIHANSTTSSKIASHTQTHMSYSPGEAFLIPYESTHVDFLPETPTTAIHTYVPDLRKLTGFLTESGATKEQINALIR